MVVEVELDGWVGEEGGMEGGEEEGGILESG